MFFDTFGLAERRNRKKKGHKKEMKKEGKKKLIFGSIFVIIFAIWTALIQIVDVQAVGQNGTDIGFATFNCWFHKITGVNMTLYTVTDWLGLVPLVVSLMFAGVGVVQLVKRKSLLKVDSDILILGIYYVVVVFCYLVFEMIPINYRPILIEGIMEASYPSSTTLLVLCVMPTLMEQMNRRVKNGTVNKVIGILVISFSVFMVLGRLISGVHWFTDIVGSVFLSVGLFFIYKAFVLICY
uniref:phosphatase PAP2 family protein n=1 Tax=Roseburia hominis TaxID=301301 RepID=UPI004037B0C4